MMLLSFAQGIDLRMRRFLFEDVQSLRAPYSLEGDLLLTQEDISRSQFLTYLTQVWTRYVAAFSKVLTLFPFHPSYLSTRLYRLLCRRQKKS